MKSAIIHIGTEKSGSTFLQELLLANLPGLKRAGLQYPSVFRSGNHGELAAAFAPTPSPMHTELGITDCASQLRFRAALEQQLESLPSGQWLFSNEHLSSRLDNETLVRDFLQLMQQHFESITIVAFLRRQDFMFPSAYSTYVKSGGSKPISARFIPETYLDHGQLVRRWTAGLRSGDTLRLEPYLETFQASASAIARRFEEACGMPASVLTAMPDGAENRRLSVPALEAMRAINARIGGAGGIELGTSRELVFRKLSEVLAGPAWDITTDHANELRDHWRSSNESLFAEFPNPGWRSWREQRHVGVPEEWIERGLEFARAIDGVLAFIADEQLLASRGMANAHEAKQRSAYAERRMTVMQSSLSWRLTAPLRGLRQQVRATRPRRKQG
jgi:hypothetical protein